MGRSVNKPTQLKISTKEKLKLRKKESKQKIKEKRARLVVRNLPFKATEENLKEYFKEYGEVGSVQLLKAADGKLKGVGFVQFNLVQKAAKAKHHTNGKPFMGRALSVDFALSKTKYEKAKQDSSKDKEIKEEEEEIKEEPIDVDDIVDRGGNDVKELKEEDSEESDGEESNHTVYSEEEDDEYDEEIEDEKKEHPDEKKPHVISNDVSEGKTVFVKNVPFTATNEDLKEVMQQFGPIYYALICMDKMTEHSKGTAFVKFREKESAEQALNAGTELKLMGQILDCHPALSRNEMSGKAESKIKSKQQPKDSRNLYLIKEGVVLANSKAAEGVSVSDMAKRLQLEQYKTQMLRNLNMFISRERLIVHNLPASWDDKKLRTLFQKYTPKGAIIKEARVMRNLRDIDENGIGRSKEYGFVTFAKHEDALTALRNLNNNPKIFSPNKRPIVAFSIENKAMIKARQKRLEKSLQKNPKSKLYNPEVKETKSEEKQEDNDSGKTFTGITAKPGPQKMRSRYNLKKQAIMHYENLKKEKKKKKFAKKSLKEKQEEFTKQPKQKINKRKAEDDNLGKLVANYRKNLPDIPQTKKPKWYE